MDPVGPRWRFSFPWEDWDTPPPEVGADLQLTLSDGRTTSAIVERVQVEIELTDAWIYCAGTEPTRSPTEAAGA